MTTHHTEQAARGYVMYELAKRKYTVQFTDSRFPKEDLLVVSSAGKHFGIDVKGQSTKSFWQFSQRKANDELFIVFAYVSMQGAARCFVVPSVNAMALWQAYKKSAVARGATHNRWGINWTTPHNFEDKWDLLPP